MRLSMLLDTIPGYRGTCIRARWGCTCFYGPDRFGKRSKAIRRHRARRIEQRRWRKEEGLQ